MEVKTLIKGLEITGLDVGEGNVERYFPADARVIELQLDHLHILCGLAPDFWRGQPEIHDPRLSAWLECKHFHKKPGQPPMPIRMTPLGGSIFRLQPIRHRTHVVANPLPPAN